MAKSTVHRGQVVFICRLYLSVITFSRSVCVPFRVVVYLISMSDVSPLLMLLMANSFVMLKIVVFFNGCFMDFAEFSSFLHSVQHLN